MHTLMTGLYARQCNGQSIKQVLACLRAHSIVSNFKYPTYDCITGKTIHHDFFSAHLGFCKARIIKPSPCINTRALQESPYLESDTPRLC
jgi:hypothetical protein